MWALGCILHILLCGKVPFSSINSKVQDQKVVKGDWNTNSKVGMCCFAVARLPSRLPHCVLSNMCLQTHCALGYTVCCWNKHTAK